MNDPLSVRSVRWDITNLCNLNCAHCYSSPDENHDLGFERIVDIIEKLIPLGLREINLSGREPTLRKDLITICAWCRQKSLSVNVTTNGTVWSLHDYEDLLRTDINMIVFSLDGATATTHNRIRGAGNFDITIKNIKHCTEYVRQNDTSCKIGISCTIQRYNAHEASRMIDICRDADIDFLGVNPVSFCGSASSMRSSLYMAPSDIAQCWEDLCVTYMRSGPRFELYLGVFPMEAKYLNAKYKLDLPVVYTGCSAGKTIYVDPAGKALPCYMLPAMASARPELEGYLTYWQVLDESYEKGAESFKPFISFARAYSQKANRDCIDCPDADVCKRCPLIALSDQDAIMRCHMARVRLDSMKADFKDDALISVKKHIQWKLDNGSLYLHIKKGDYLNTKTLELNPIAQAIWHEINGINTVGNIKRILKEKLSVEYHEDIHQYLSDVIDYIWKEGIITTEGWHEKEYME